MKRILMPIIFLVLALAIALAMARNLIIRAMVQKLVEQQTGFELEIDSLQLGMFRPAVDLRGVRLYNPVEFPDQDAVEIQRLYVRYDPLSFFRSEVRLRQLIVEVPQVVLVRKEDGESNLERIRQAGQRSLPQIELPQTPDEPDVPPEADDSFPEPTQAPSKKPQGKKEPPPPSPRRRPPEPKTLRIDQLTLRLGTVSVRNYATRSQEPKESAYNLNIDRTFSDVTDFRKVAAMLTADVMGGLFKSIDLPIPSLKLDSSQIEEVKDQWQSIADGLRQKLNSSSTAAPKPPEPEPPPLPDAGESAAD